MIREYLLYPVTDYIGTIIAEFIAFQLTPFIIIAVKFIMYATAAYMLNITYKKLFTNKRNRYHWTKLKADTKKYIGYFSEDKSIIEFMKWSLTGFTWLVYYLGFLIVFIIFCPDDGQHFLDMFTNENISRAMMISFTLTGLMTGFKACGYVLMGANKSVGVFNLKMIFLP